MIGVTYAIYSVSSLFQATTSKINIDEDAYGNTSFDSSNIDFVPILDSEVEDSIDNIIKITFRVGGASDNSDVVIITNTGILIRLPLAQVSTLGRVTQGVRLIHLKDNQNVSTISIVEHEEENPSDVIEEVKEES